jgi:hypothetical protein
MLGLGQPVIDAVLGAGVFECMRPNELSSLQGGLDVRRRRARITWRGEVGSVVGEDGMDLVRDGGDQAAQEVSCGATRHFLMQLDKGGLRRSVDGDKQVELALRGSNLGDADMKIADSIGLEFAFGGGFTFHLGQPRDPVALQTPVKGRARQMRDGGLQSVQAVVERQQGMPSEGDDDGLFLG